MSAKRAKFSSEQSIPKTLSQSIYNYLKDAIINNKLKANQRIVEKEIAGVFKVSTTPVREAVLRLSAEGFVNIDSHKEAVVKEISYEELKEIFHVMATLDSLATVLAAENIKPEDLKELESLADKMEHNCHIRSFDKYMAYNNAIHSKIWKLVPNGILRKTLHYVNDQLLRYNSSLISAFHKPGVLEKSLEEHKDILKALKSKDKKHIKTLVTSHWESLLKPSPFEDGLKESLIRE